MFQQYRNIDSAFRYVRLFTFVVIAAAMVICCFTVIESYRMVSRMQQHIYILANDKAFELFAADRKDNIPVEARDHIKTFHQHFFTLDPDEKVIDAGIRQALYLADISAKKQYDDLKEGGYYSGIISGNISQRITMDSIVLDMQSEPYHFRYFGHEQIIRPTAVLTRSLVTEGFLRNVNRSDNNSHGFLIERWRILENNDLNIQNR